MLKITRWTFITLLSIVKLSNNIYAQKTINNLLFIEDMPIKIDGGCSFYVDKNIQLNEGKFQLVIDAHHHAFIEFKKGKYLFFNLVKRQKTDHYYKEYYKTDIKSNSWYKGKAGSFMLKIDSMGRYKDNQTLRIGTLNLVYPGLTQTLKVWGKAYIVDEYYYKFYPKILFNK